ncbi:uncharacterized protein LOC111430696 isoform X2 [Cucurbita moschata]|uniref:Uncharacterized protein LOC111430696 isoform X2 n=1 Tax=Cucurbita moschata TaxID=3662 RepID=A0A6J1E4F2_CUCMO|nr:uncharacterized protein LOC111430696 isoform X2 [Cucurbita moschata]XP_022922832.1 uncharacterized protein LOC111430696 isoform X2 [Cucurbita moschata]
MLTSFIVLKTLALLHSAFVASFSIFIKEEMAWRSSGSLSRALISSVRSSSLRSSPSLPRLRLPPLTARPRLSFSTSRNLGELGCTQSLLPMHSIMGATCLTSHLCVSARAFCELSHGRNGKDG